MKRTNGAHETLEQFARKVASGAGSPWTFLAAVTVIVVWAGFGPLTGYSDTWQLVINTGTTICTFLVAFLIQHSQNHDTRAVHLKLDELIRALGQARTELVGMESMSDAELEALEKEFEALHYRAQTGLKKIAESRKKARPRR
jgi:low affinity Fe/Cu permease